MKVIICIPAYNEEDTLTETINDIKSAMEGHDYDWEIHVQDDGSDDNTVTVAEGNNVKVFSNPTNLGLAKTFKAELNNAKDADIIVHTDADNQYKAEHIPKLIAYAEDWDLVLGSRFFNSDRYKGQFTKRIGNKIFSYVISKLIRTKVTDSTTGFRAFNQKVASLPLINTFTYTQEQLIRTAKAGLKIIEVPIYTNDTRKSRLFKNPLDYAIRAWINIFRIYRDFDPIKFFGKMGVAIMIPGIMLTLYTITSYLMYGPGKLTKFALAALFFLLAGVQIISFGFIADMMRRD